MKPIKLPFSEREKQAIEKCDELIEDFATRAIRHKSRYKRLQTTSISLAVLSTILAALLAGNKIGEYAWVVPLTSGLSALATTFMSQTTSQKLWVGSRSTSQKFQSERFLYIQNSGDYSNLGDKEKRLNLFSNRIMEIWSQGQETWEQSTPSTK